MRSLPICTAGNMYKQPYFDLHWLNLDLFFSLKSFALNKASPTITNMKLKWEIPYTSRNPLLLYLK